jgi:hypothetical protein
MKCDIDEFASQECDKCDYKKQIICLTCKVKIMYLAIRDGVTIYFEDGCHDIEKCVRHGTIKALKCNSFLAIKEGIK